MITIESREDIELLIEFFNIFNAQSEQIEESEEQSSEEAVKQIKDDICRLQNQIKNLQKEITELKNQDTGIADDDTEISSSKTIRNYPPSSKKLFPNIHELTEDGHFCIGKNGNVISDYTIETILQLEKLIPSDLNWKQIGNKVGLSSMYAQSLSWGIENGKFEQWKEEWKQMKADEFFHNVKPVEIENNPQKRKEIMGMS